MRWRWTTWLALGLWLVMLTLIAGTLVMKALDWHGNNDTSNSGLVALYVAVLGFATMGSLVAARVPRNPLGWIFLAIALLSPSPAPPRTTRSTASSTHRARFQPPCSWAGSMHGPGNRRSG